MRKFLSAILLLLIFFSLQLGKAVSYMYCKWKTIVVEHKAECDCEKQLAGLYGGSAPQDQLAGMPVTELPTEYFPHSPSFSVDALLHSIKNSFAGYTASLPDRAPAAQWRPPAVKA